MSEKELLKVKQNSKIKKFINMAYGIQYNSDNPDIRKNFNEKSKNFRIEHHKNHKN